ncbi:MAG: DUF2795 domain-containing protein [Acidobacteriaceae bacterium]
MDDEINSNENEVTSRVINFLEGAAFPTDKQSLIAHASLGGAPEEVLQLLDLIPDKQYADLAEVADAVAFL